MSKDERKLTTIQKRPPHAGASASPNVLKTAIDPKKSARLVATEILLALRSGESHSDLLSEAKNPSFSGTLEPPACVSCEPPFAFLLAILCGVLVSL